MESLHWCKLEVDKEREARAASFLCQSSKYCYVCVSLIHQLVEMSDSVDMITRVKVH